MTQLVTTPFGPQSTASEVLAGVDLTSRSAIVTGGAGGLGRETARALASAGAEVTIAARTLEAGAAVAREIAEETGNARTRGARLDLADLASVAAFVSDWAGPLHILVNNAGIMATPNCAPRTAGSCSSPPTTWATSP